MKQSTRLIVLTLPGYTDPGIAIAASRAAALGVLDLEYTLGVGVALTALVELARFGKGELGVKIDLSREDFAAAVLEGLPAEISTVIIARPSTAQLARQIQPVQRSGHSVLIEATDAATASAAADAGAAGIILKGDEAAGRIGEETAFVLFQRCIARVKVPLWVQGGMGPHTAAACIAGGAAGVVLDW